MKKTKILVALVSYGTNQDKFSFNLHKRNYFNQDNYMFTVLNEWNNIDTTKYEVDLKLYITDDVDISKYSNIKVEKLIYNSNITDLLTWQYRDLFIKEKNNYNLFIYNENDMLITQRHIDTLLDITPNLPKRSAVGFLRYEEYEGKKYLIDFSFGPKEKIQLVKEVGDDVLVSPVNTNQSCHILTKEQLNLLIDDNLYTPTNDNPRKYFKDGSSHPNTTEWWNKNFFQGDKRGYIRCKTSSASEPYSIGRLLRYISINNYDNLLIHHLSNDYVKGKNQFWGRGHALTDTELKTELIKEYKNEI